MIVLKLFVISCFIFFWLASKPSRIVEVSDFFIISFLGIYLPGFVFNPGGGSHFNQLVMPSKAIAAGEIGFLIALLAGILVFLLRYCIERRFVWLRKTAGYANEPDIGVKLAWIAAALSFSIAAMLLLAPDFRAFKLNVLQFATLKMDGPEYRILRNVSYSDSIIVGSLIERARFTIFPILFCLILYPILKRCFAFVVPIVAVVFFLALPASLSKLPFLFFVGYVALLIVVRIPELRTIGWLALLSFIGSGLTIEALSVLYVAQYQGSVIAGSTLPIDLAIQRIWGEPYSVVVRYFTTYPDILPFTGWRGVSLIAQFFGMPVRMPDLEVANTILGTDSGSNPGVYFLGGYAAFGMVGLTLFALVGFLGVWLLDVIGRKIRLVELKAVYFAVIGMNMLFLNQIALQTALLTYGLSIIPVLILALDYIFFRTVGNSGDKNAHSSWL